MAASVSTAVEPEAVAVPTPLLAAVAAPTPVSGPALVATMELRRVEELAVFVTSLRLALL